MTIGLIISFAFWILRGNLYGYIVDESIKQTYRTASGRSWTAGSWSMSWVNSKKRYSGYSLTDRGRKPRPPKTIFFLVLVRQGKKNWIFYWVVIRDKRIDSLSSFVTPPSQSIKIKFPYNKQLVIYFNDFIPSSVLLSKYNMYRPEGGIEPLWR